MKMTYISIPKTYQQQVYWTIIMAAVWLGLGNKTTWSGMLLNINRPLCVSYSTQLT